MKLRPRRRLRMLDQEEQQHTDPQPFALAHTSHQNDPDLPHFPLDSCPIARKTLRTLPENVQEAAGTGYATAFPNITHHVLDIKGPLRDVSHTKVESIEEFESSEQYDPKWLKIHEGLSQLPTLEDQQDQVKAFYKSLSFHPNRWFHRGHIPELGLAQGQVLFSMALLGNSLHALRSVGVIQMKAIHFLLWRVSVKIKKLEDGGNPTDLLDVLSNICVAEGGIYQDEILFALFTAGTTVSQYFVPLQPLLEAPPTLGKRKCSEITKDSRHDIFKTTKTVVVSELRIEDECISDTKGNTTSEVESSIGDKVGAEDTTTQHRHDCDDDEEYFSRVQQEIDEAADVDVDWTGNSHHHPAPLSQRPATSPERRRIRTRRGYFGSH